MHVAKENLCWVLALQGLWDAVEQIRFLPAEGSGTHVHGNEAERRWSLALLERERKAFQSFP